MMVTYSIGFDVDHQTIKKIDESKAINHLYNYHYFASDVPGLFVNSPSNPS